MHPILPNPFSHFSPSITDPVATTPSDSPLTTPMQESSLSITPQKILIPSMGHGLAAHFLAGEAAQNLTVGQERLEGFSQKHLLAYYANSLENQAKKIGIDKEPVIQQLLQDFTGALELEQQVDALQKAHEDNWSASVSAFTHLMQTKIQSLKIHESLLIPGGWTQAVADASGHAMLYRITKTGDTTFSFEIYNTGGGVEFHPGAILDERQLQTQKLKKNDLSLEQISNPLFWQTHYEVLYSPAEGFHLISPVHIYRSFDIIADSFVERAGKETLVSTDVELRRPQAAGHCTYESLLAYNKLQIGKISSPTKRSLYHQLKMEMQLQVLKEYFAYLQEKHMLDKPSSPEEAATRFPLLNLICSEIHTVRRTLLRELKKRHKQLSKQDKQTIQVHIQDCEKWSQQVLQSRELCQKTLKISSEVPDILSIDKGTSTPVATLAKVTMTKEEILEIEPTKKPKKIIHFVPVVPELPILNPLEKILDSLKKCRTLTSLDLRQIPDVTDPFWDTLDNPQSVLESICQFLLHEDHGPRLKNSFATIKLFAISCKLFKSIKNSYLAFIPLFSQEFIHSVFFSGTLGIDTLVVSSAEELDSFLLSKKYLESISSKKGIFDEWLTLKPFENQNKYFKKFSSETPLEDLPLWMQHTAVFLDKNPKILEDINKNLISRGEFRSEKNIPKIAQCIEATHSENEELKTFFLFEKSAFLLSRINKNISASLLTRKIEKNASAYEISYQIPTINWTYHNPSERIFHDFGFAGQINAKQKIILSCWDQSSPEKDCRHLDKEESVIDFLIKTIISTDDLSLRLLNGINFFSSHRDLLKQRDFQVFIFKLLFGNFTNEKNALPQILKSNKLLTKKLTSFLKTNFYTSIKTKDFDTASFLFSSMHLLIEFHKKFLIDESIPIDLAIPEQDLLSLTNSNRGLAALIQMLSAQENISNYSQLMGVLLQKMMKGNFNKVHREYSKNQWPFCDPSGLSKVFHHFVDSLSEKEKDTFFSTHILGIHPPVSWKYEPPCYSYKEYQIDMDQCEVRVLGESTFDYYWQFVVSDDSFKAFFPHPEKLRPITVYPSKQKDKGYAGLFTDEHGVEYLFDSTSKKVYSASRGYEIPEYTYRVYRKQGDFLSAMVSVLSLAPGDAWSRLGISHEWQAFVGDKTIDLVDPKGKIAFQYHQYTHLLREVSSHLIAMDMSKQESLQQYAAFLELDPKSQLWKPEKESVPCRLTCPTFGLTFEIKDGKILGTGEWEGFTVAKEQHIRALRGFRAKVVLQHKELGTVVLLPDGEMKKTTNLQASMHFTTHTDGKKRLFPMALDKQGRIKATNREEELYLARLFYHLIRPKAAMRCLKRCMNSEAWNLSELRSLTALVLAAGSKKTLSDTCLFLKGILLLKEIQGAHRLPWQTVENEVEKQELSSIQKSIDTEFFATTTLSYTQSIAQYRQLITQIPYSLRLTKQEERSLRSTPNTPQTYFFSSQEVDLIKMNTEKFIEIMDRSILTKHVDRTPNLDIFHNQALRVSGEFQECLAHFWDFYAIATEPGSTPRKEKLASWLKVLYSLNHPENIKKSTFATFFLNLLEMDSESQKSLPSQKQLAISLSSHDPQEFLVQFDHLLSLVKTETSPLLPRASPAFIDPSTPAYQKASGIRKEKLQRKDRVHFPERRLNSNVDTFKQIVLTEKTNPLLTTAEKLFLPQLTSPKKRTLPILKPLDSAGSIAYKKTFTTLEEGLKSHQIAQTEMPHWTITQDNLRSLQEQLDDKAKTIAELQKDFLSKKSALLKKTRELGLTKKNLSIRDLEEGALFAAPIRWSDLLFLFAKQDANAYLIKQHRLTKAEAQEIFEETAQCLFLQTRLQRLEKARFLIKELLIRENPQQIDQLKELLTQTRDYPVDRFPAIVLFEAVTEMQLRKDQIENLQKLADPDSDWLVEAIMGSGKSEVLIPLFAQTVADGQHLALAVIPKEQMQSAGSRLEKKLLRLFEQNSVQINWKDVSLPHLQAISDRLEEAIRNKEVVRLYADELQHFFLQEKFAMHSYFQGNQKALPVMEEFKKIRKILQTKGVALVDEVHLQLMRKRECQKPLGEKVPIEPSFSILAADLQLLLLQDPKIRKKFIFASSSPPIPREAIPFIPNLHQKDFVSLLTEAFAKYRYADHLKKQQKAREFLQAPQDQPISLDSQLFSQQEIANLAFARGQIQVILPATLSKKHAQDYGLFPSSKKGLAPPFLAGPYRGLDKPVIGSTFASPDELIAYTIQSYLIQGVSTERLQSQIQSLLSSARQEVFTYNRPLEKTAGYVEYLRLIGAHALDPAAKKKLLQEFPFEETDSQKWDMIKLQQYIHKNPILLIYFLKRFVLDKVTQYPTTAVANGFSFVNLFHAVKGVSGTLHAAPTFHGRFQKALNPEIEAEAFSLLTKSSEPPFLLSDQIEGIPLLQKLLSQASNHSYRALIDQGALIKAPPLHIAEKILEFTTEFRPVIDRVIYFDQDQLLCLERGKKEPAKYNPEKCPPETSFTFYDQTHATGTDIWQMQGANAFVTLHENTSYADVCQAGFRMRGLKDLDQNVTFVPSYELVSTVKAHLQKNGEPNDSIQASDLLRYSKHIQSLAAEEENFKAVLDKMYGLFVEECQKQIDEGAPNSTKWFHWMLRENRLNPVAAYASSWNWVSPKKLFEHIRDDYLKKIEGDVDTTNLEIAMNCLIEEATHEKNPLVADRVLSKSNPLVDFEAREMEMLQEQQQELQQNVQEEQQQQQQQQKDLSAIKMEFATTGTLGTEVPLFEPKHLTSFSWKQQTALAQLPDQPFTTIPSIYPISALVRFGVSKKEDPFIRKKEILRLADQLPKKVLFSLHATTASADSPPFRKNQLILDKLLVIPDPENPQEPYLIALSKKESELWYQAFLDKKNLPKELQEACLFSLESDAFSDSDTDGTVIAGNPKFSLQSLRSHFRAPPTYFEETTAKIKWLMGHTQMYSPKEQGILIRWMQELGADTMEKWFMSWFSVAYSPYPGSILEATIKSAKQSLPVSPQNTSEIEIEEPSASFNTLSEDIVPQGPTPLNPKETSSVKNKAKSSPVARFFKALFFSVYLLGWLISRPFRWVFPKNK